VQLLLLFVVTTLLHVAVSFPLSYYSGYRLEHRFGLSRLSPVGWLWRYAKVKRAGPGVRLLAVCRAVFG